MSFSDIAEVEAPQPTTTAKAYRPRLSDEDQLYVWCLALQNNIAGKVAPAQRKGWESRTEYALLLNETNAAALLNSVSDTPITTDQLRAIAKRYRHSNPPFGTR